MYVPSSYANPGDNAAIASEFLTGGSCVRFYYHMHGPGALSVYQQEVRK